MVKEPRHGFDRRHGQSGRGQRRQTVDRDVDRMDVLAHQMVKPTLVTHVHSQETTPICSIYPNHGVVGIPMQVRSLQPVESLVLSPLRTADFSRAYARAHRDHVDRRILIPSLLDFGGLHIDYYTLDSRRREVSELRQSSTVRPTDWNTWSDRVNSCQREVVGLTHGAPANGQEEKQTRVPGSWRPPKSIRKE